MIQNPDFAVTAAGDISEAFRKRGVYSFAEAAALVCNLPYARNTAKENHLCVLLENCGTCSTKHALLKRLADENGHPEIELVLGIFRMNGNNTPAVAATLQKHGLKEMPEAHNYLRRNGVRFDFTKKGFAPEKFVPDLLEETDITPEQITDYKVNYHRAFLQRWLALHPEIPFTLQEYWRIREACIAALS